jgi:hypothetical protein
MTQHIPPARPQVRNVFVLSLQMFERAIAVLGNSTMCACNGYLLAAIASGEYHFFALSQDLFCALSSSYAGDTIALLDFGESLLTDSILHYIIRS